MSIHPSSVLFHSKPACIVFTELVQTGKRYVRQVTLVDSDWIEELPKETLLLLKQVISIIFPFIHLYLNTHIRFYLLQTFRGSGPQQRH